MDCPVAVAVVLGAEIPPSSASLSGVSAELVRDGPSLLATKYRPVPCPWSWLAESRSVVRSPFVESQA